MAESLQEDRDVASTRILRLSVGIALALAFSQAVNWTASFITPVLVSILLALPLPAPKIKFALGFVAIIGGALLLGLLFLPMLHNQPGAGVVLITLAVFLSFYLGASGGSAPLVTFLLMGVLLIPAVGSESVDAALMLTLGVVIGAAIAFLFIWLAFAIFPEPALPGSPAAAAQSPDKPSAQVAIRSALRSSAVVMPVMLWFLFSSDTIGYAAALIKIATMGQQTSREDTSQAGRDLLLSTLIGGIAAVIVWNILQVWPSLLIYSLLFMLCGLVIGPRIFSGAGMAARGSVWSYGLMTMMVIVAPGAMDGAGGDAAAAKFADRITMFVIATLYAVAAVYAFDALWPDKNKKQDQIGDALEGAHQ